MSIEWMIIDQCPWVSVPMDLAAARDLFLQAIGRPRRKPAKAANHSLVCPPAAPERDGYFVTHKQCQMQDGRSLPAGRLWINDLWRAERRSRPRGVKILPNAQERQERSA